MSHRRHRHQVLWYLLMGGGLILAGTVLVRTGTAPTDLLQRTTTPSMIAPQWLASGLRDPAGALASTSRGSA
jgi:hypothetical protein